MATEAEVEWKETLVVRSLSPLMSSLMCNHYIFLNLLFFCIFLLNNNNWNLFLLLFVCFVLFGPVPYHGTVKREHILPSHRIAFQFVFIS